jgi:hypothetical protein
VLAQQGHNLTDEPTSLALACEAVVKNEDDDWVPALVMQMVEGRYFVHYVGQDMDENEWVNEDRVRFPAGSGLPELMASTLRDQPSRNGAPGKPPVEMEV